MKNIVFIVSHLGSGSQLLFNQLDKNSRIQGFKVGKPYSHPFVLNDLIANPHKLRNSAAIYADELLFNFSLCCDNLFSICKFIYLIREPRDTLNNILNQYNYTPHCAYNYYRHRLRRMYEMAKNTPEAVFLTWEDVLSKKGLVLIENYLRLKEPIEDVFGEVITEKIDNIWIKAAETTYEKYLYKIKNRLISE